MNIQDEIMAKIGVINKEIKDIDEKVVVEKKVFTKEFKYEYEPTSQSDFTRHNQSKHPRGLYSCDQCEYQATQPISLTGHNQSEHLAVQYSCDQCEYKATQQSSLTTHKQYKHLRVRYSCDECVYQATQQGSLTTHKQSNTLECDIAVTNVSIKLLN